MGNASFARGLVEQLDGWVNDLAAPLMPPRMVAEGDDLIRLEFRQPIPHAVKIDYSLQVAFGPVTAQLSSPDQTGTRQPWRNQCVRFPAKQRGASSSWVSGPERP